MLLYEVSSGEVSVPSSNAILGNAANTRITLTDTRFQLKSHNLTDLLTCPNVCAFVQLMIMDMKSRQWCKPETNLTHDESRALKML